MLICDSNQMQEVWQKCGKVNYDILKKIIRIVYHPVGFFLFTSFIFILGGLWPEYAVKIEIKKLMNSNESVVSTIPTYLMYVRPEYQERLEHVRGVLAHLGFKGSTSTTEWDLFWSFTYPFLKLFKILSIVQPHQKVNHIPGAVLITNKEVLSMEGHSYQPKAFLIPKDREKLLEYARANQNALFVEKGIAHRGVKITNIYNAELWKKPDVFIQEYIANPLLVDGHKFEMGVYTIVTSIDPLRIYIYNGDILFRYCPMKYHPFDHTKTDKYVTTEFYLPTWELPSLTQHFSALEHSMRDCFVNYFDSKGVDTKAMFQQVEEAITDVMLQKEDKMKEFYKVFQSKQSFFELLRFDFIVDDNLRVYLLEVNLSPNLSSKRRPQSAVLYEQLLYSTMSLVGVAHYDKTERTQKEQVVLHPKRNILTNESNCSTRNCALRCGAAECSLCWKCLDEEMKQNLNEAYREHLHRVECKRIFPPTMTGEDLPQEHLNKFSPRNQIMMKWFNAKCKEDLSWC